MEDAGEVSPAEAEKARQKLQSERDKAEARADEAGAEAERHEAAVKLFRVRINETESDEKARPRKESVEAILEAMNEVETHWREAGEAAIKLNELVAEAAKAGVRLPVLLPSIVPHELTKLTSAGPGVRGYTTCAELWKKRMRLAITCFERELS